MDNQTYISQLKETNRRFCEDRDWDQYHGPKDLAIGIITEASELLEHFRFKSEAQINEMFQSAQKKKEISEELADVLFFILRFSQMYGIDLSESLEKKMEVNGRKYPAEKCKGLNKKYTEL